MRIPFSGGDLLLQRWRRSWRRRTGGGGEVQGRRALPVPGRLAPRGRRVPGWRPLLAKADEIGLSRSPNSPLSFVPVNA